MNNHCVFIVKCIRNVCIPHFKIFKISKNISKNYKNDDIIKYVASTTNELTEMKSISCIIFTHEKEETDNFFLIESSSCNNDTLIYNSSSISVC